MLSAKRIDYTAVEGYLQSLRAQHASALKNSIAESRGNVGRKCTKLAMSLTEPPGLQSGVITRMESDAKVLECKVNSGEKEVARRSTSQHFWEVSAKSPMVSTGWKPACQGREVWASEKHANCTDDGKMQGEEWTSMKATQELEEIEGSGVRQEAGEREEEEKDALLKDCASDAKVLATAVEEDEQEDTQNGMRRTLMNLSFPQRRNTQGEGMITTMEWIAYRMISCVSTQLNWKRL